MQASSFSYLLVIALGACGNSKPYLDAAVPIDAGVDAPAPDACVARTCDSAFRYCNTIDDGCGNQLACGACPAPLTCGVHEANVCGIEPADRVCNAAGWCWEHPLPFGMDLTSAWSASANDVWATGAGGTLLRTDGAAWRAVASGTDLDLAAIWGTAANNAYIVGREGYLRRWNGTSVVVPPGAPQDIYANDVHGSSASDVWVTGSFGANGYAHFDGTTWTGFPNPQFFAPSTVFALSPTDAWAFGFADTAQHWDGTAWTQLEGVSGNDAAWASGANDVWVVGDGIVHWNGTAWTALFDGPLGDQYAIEGTSASDIWVGGELGLHHFDGAAWSSVATDAEIHGLRVDAANTAWAVGRSGRTYQWDGTSWTKRTGFGVAYSLETIAKVSDTELWFIGSGAMRWKDGVIADFGTATFTPNWFDVVGAWASSATDVWAAGPGGEFAHWDGTTWTTSHPIADLPDVTAMWGTAANNIYAVTDVKDPFNPSDSYILHWDGTTWSVAATLQTELMSIGGSGPNDIWVGGDGGFLQHWNGTQWETTPALEFSSDVFHISASPIGTVHLATRSGVYRRTGTTWTRLAGLDGAVGSVIGSDTDLWATVGDPLSPTAVVAHYNGVTWTKENTGGGQPIRRLELTTTDIFAIGRSGAIMRKPR